MLEKLIAAALTRPALAHRVLRDELDRLREGGYLSEQELDGLRRETLEKLSERLEQARVAVSPLVSGLGESLREALDIPSRSEVRALTEELRRRRADGADDPRV